MVNILSYDYFIFIITSYDNTHKTFYLCVLMVCQIHDSLNVFIQLMVEVYTCLVFSKVARNGHTAWLM